MTQWLESIYTFFSRVWDYLTFVFDYINEILTYVFDSAGNVLYMTGSLPASIAGIVILSIAVCVFLFVLGR